MQQQKELQPQLQLQREEVNERLEGRRASARSAGLDRTGIGDLGKTFRMCPLVRYIGYRITLQLSYAWLGRGGDVVSGFTDL